MYSLEKMEKKENESLENYDVFSTRGFQKIDKAVKQSIAIVKEAKLGKRDVLPTSWPRLNRNLLGGLQRGKMYVIAGRPGVGKSAFSNQLIFDIPTLISYISKALPWNAGDVLVTGTPGGVGFKRNPPIFMKPGDKVEVDITDIGVLSNTIKDEII